MYKLFKKKFNEIPRDLIALGGLPFFILIVARVWLLSKPYYSFQFIFGGIIFLTFMFVFKAEIHAGLGLVVLIFISIYYNSLNFTIFASLAYILLLISLVYLENNKKEIGKGILFGGIATGTSWYLVEVLFL